MIMLIILVKAKYTNQNYQPKVSIDKKASHDVIIYTLSKERQGEIYASPLHLNEFDTSAVFNTMELLI